MARGVTSQRQRVTRRRLLQLGLALPLLQACGRATGPTTTLNVFLPLDAYERAFFARQVLPPFTQQHQISVQLSRGTGAEAIEQLVQADRTGTASVDLLALDLEHLGALIAGGIVQPLDRQRDTVPETTIPTLAPALEVAGTRYALPFRPAIWLTFYNAALLGEYGAAPPATWEALLALAGALPATTGAGQIALQGATGAPAAQSLLELVWAFGGDPLRLDDDGARAAGDYLQRLAPLLSPLSATAKFDTMTAALGSNRVALGANWSVVAADLLQRGGNRNIRVYPGPAGPAGNVRLLSGQVLAVPARTRQREAALLFADYLLSQPVQRLLAGQLAWTPVRADAFDAAPAWQAPVAQAIHAALPTARALPLLIPSETVNIILSDAFRAIAFERAAPRATLAEAARRLQAVRPMRQDR